MAEQSTAREGRQVFTTRARIAVAVVVIVVLGVGSVAVAKNVAPSEYAVQGRVMCINHAGAVGIWVNTDGGQGHWADRHGVDVDNGWAWTGFSTRIPNGGSYSLDVGCGGRPDNWELTAHSSTLTATSLDVVCNDIPPWLDLLGKMFFPILKKSFSQDIPYGRCEAVRQVANLEPRPLVTTEVPTLPAPAVPPEPTLETVPPPAPQPPVPPSGPTTEGQPNTSVVPQPVPVVHYDCADSDSEVGHFIGPNTFWNDGPFPAAGRTITGGWVLIGAHEDGRDHRGLVQIWTGPMRTGQLLGQTEVHARGYDGEEFTFPQPIQVTPGQQLYLAVVSTGSANNEGFTAYDSAGEGCFVGRVVGTS